MRSTVAKRRAHRKFVRKQKQLIRRRTRKHKPRKWFIIHLDLKPETRELIANKAKELGVSEQTVVTMALKKAMKEWRSREIS